MNALLSSMIERCNRVGSTFHIRMYVLSSRLTLDRSRISNINEFSLNGYFCVMNRTVYSSERNSRFRLVSELKLKLYPDGQLLLLKRETRSSQIVFEIFVSYCWNGAMSGCLLI